jgi:two-component system, chemotaxis family, chemotaxis protein CheY
MTATKTVLVVDDSASVRQQVVQALSQAGFLTVEASDGADALAKLEATPEIQLMISDINMPQMNGLDLVDRVKSDDRHQALPILMLTSEGQPALIARARKAGVKGWIVKPFKTEMLVAAIKKLLAS